MNPDRRDLLIFAGALVGLAGAIWLVTSPKPVAPPATVAPVETEAGMPVMLVAEPFYDGVADTTGSLTIDWGAAPPYVSDAGQLEDLGSIVFDTVTPWVGAGGWTAKGNSIAFIDSDGEEAWREDLPVLDHDPATGCPRCPVPGARVYPGMSWRTWGHDWGCPQRPPLWRTDITLFVCSRGHAWAHWCSDRRGPCSDCGADWKPPEPQPRTRLEPTACIRCRAKVCVYSDLCGGCEIHLRDSGAW